VPFVPFLEAKATLKKAPIAMLGIEVLNVVLDVSGNES